MTDFTIQEAKDGELIIGGMLTIENAAAICRALLDALSRLPQIRITVADDSITDLSFLQIICSMHRSAARTGKIVIQGSFSTPFISVLADAGFARSKGCMPGMENNCLWIIGGKDD